MSRKRHNTSSPELDSPSPKRHKSPSPIDLRSNDETIRQKSERPQVNQWTGQTSAFPGLDAEDEFDEDDPSDNALAYLRMVRSEADSLPTFFGVKRTSNEMFDDSNECDEEENGIYYDDGAYTAAPDPVTLTPSIFPPAQQHYYDAILVHFKALRATMRCTPPLDAVQGLGQSRLISFPPESTAARDAWQKHMMDTYPSPIQVACMDVESVLELIKFIKRRLMHMFSVKKDEVKRRLAVWTWAILAKCPDLGELGSEEVAELRELAQKAIQWLDKSEAQTTKENSNVMDEVSNEDEEGHGTIADVRNGDTADTGKAISQAALQSSLAMDMIVTIVGEVYGQRDLLEQRKVWSVQ